MESARHHRTLLALSLDRDWSVAHNVCVVQDADNRACDNTEEEDEKCEDEHERTLSGSAWGNAGENG